MGIFSSGHLRWRRVLAFEEICGQETREVTYSAEFVALNRVLLAPTESTLIHELRELLLHQLSDLGHSLFESLLGSAGDVKVERRVLINMSMS